MQPPDDAHTKPIYTSAHQPVPTTHSASCSPHLAQPILIHPMTTKVRKQRASTRTKQLRHATPRSRCARNSPAEVQGSRETGRQSSVCSLSSSASQTSPPPQQQDMATETDTLSLPTSTAPTDVTESTCMPNSHPSFPSPFQAVPQVPPAADWDTKLVMPDMPHASAFPHYGIGTPSTFDCGSGSGSASGNSSGTGCFNDGGVLYRAQAEMEMREGPGKYVNPPPSSLTLSY